jgi:CheY-like chemotaxis protein
MNYFLKTVLLIDDNEIDNLLSEKLIRKTDFAETIIVRQCAEDAFDFLKNDAIANDQIPDLIFLDIRMPLGDGFYFLDVFRELPVMIKNKTKIVMLTSSLDDADHAQALENEFVKFFLGKPLTFDSLEDLKKKF